MKQQKTKTYNWSTNLVLEHLYYKIWVDTSTEGVFSRALTLRVGFR